MTKLLSEKNLNIIRGKVLVMAATKEELLSVFAHLDELEARLDDADEEDTFGTEGLAALDGLTVTIVDDLGLSPNRLRQMIDEETAWDPQKYLWSGLALMADAWEKGHADLMDAKRRIGELEHALAAGEKP